MPIRPLLECIRRYEKTWAAGTIPYPGMDLTSEASNAATVAAFAKSGPDCFSRERPDGHITGSALVTDPSLSRVLMTHHKRLNKWLQLGGHSDGHPLTWEVAMREAEEESGLTGLRFQGWFKDRSAYTASQGQPPEIFDLDYHEIPARKTEPGHIHYDVRYLIVAPPAGRVVVSEESHDVRWFDLGEAREFTREPSMLRQFDKLSAVRDALGGALTHGSINLRL